jgi:hypothetical protein
MSVKPSSPDRRHLTNLASVPINQHGPMAPPPNRANRAAARPSQPRGPDCQFILDTRSGQQLNVAEDSGLHARDNFKRRKRIAQPLIPVTDVGEDAYWLPDETILHALANQTRIYIAFRSDVGLPPAARSHAVALARIALKRALQPPRMRP